MLLAVVSGLIGAFVGAGLEKVKTANSEVIELTKRRIDRTSEVYDRINAKHKELVRLKSELTITVLDWANAPSAAASIAAETKLVKTVTEFDEKSLPDADAYDVWVEPSLRDAIDAFAMTVFVEQNVFAGTWRCVSLKWERALFMASPLGGSMPMPTKQDKAEMVASCRTVRDEEFNTIDAREKVQEGLDAFVSSATTPPGVWDLLLGTRPKPEPPPPTRKNVQLVQAIEPALRDAGFEFPRPAPPDPATLAAATRAQNEALVREIVAAESRDAAR